MEDGFTRQSLDGGKFFCWVKLAGLPDFIAILISETRSSEKTANGCPATINGAMPRKVRPRNIFPEERAMTNSGTIIQPIELFLGNIFSYLRFIAQ